MLVEFLKAFWDRLYENCCVRPQYGLMLLTLPLAYLAIHFGWSAWFVIITSAVIWAGLLIFFYKLRR